MKVLFLAYANRREDPLPSLQREDDTVYQTLSARALQQHFLLHRDSYATTEKVAHFLTLYRDNLSLFHYSGHAGEEALLLEAEAARAEGIAHLLGQCPNLQAVVLNGCSTQGQVARLLEAGVPLVIATSAPVGDEKATRFSIRLFQALNEFYSLQEAFELALGEVKAMPDGAGLDAKRGVKLPDTPAETPLWGLFHNENREAALSWKLPAQTLVTSGSDFQPNDIFIESLMEAIAPYNTEVAKIQEDELLGVEKSILDKREAILKCLPHPISEQLRKLLVPETAGAGGVFYDKLGPDRLRQMVTTYNTIIELTAFVMLAQLWDALVERPKLQLPPEYLDSMKAFFRLGPDERRTYDFFPLISDIRSIFDANDIPYFIDELEQLHVIFRADTDFFGACMFMERIKKQLSRSRTPFGPDEAANLCVLAEEKLAAILSQLGFIANYSLASVKTIDVIKNRQIKTPRYKHNLVRLVQRFVGLAEEQEVMDKVMDSASVLLLKLKEGPPHQTYLNLTPFVIDENAFDDKETTVTKLHFFDRYEKGMDAYAFKHVYKPEDVPLVVTKQRNYLLLKAQFDTFAKLLFKQPLKTI